MAISSSELDVMERTIERAGHLPARYARRLIKEYRALLATVAQQDRIIGDEFGVVPQPVRRSRRVRQSE